MSAPKTSQEHSSGGDCVARVRRLKYRNHTIHSGTMRPATKNTHHACEYLAKTTRHIPHSAMQKLFHRKSTSALMSEPMIMRGADPTAKLATQWMVCSTSGHVIETIRGCTIRFIIAFPSIYWETDRYPRSTADFSQSVSPSHPNTYTAPLQIAGIIVTKHKENEMYSSLPIDFTTLSHTGPLTYALNWSRICSLLG